MTFAVNGIAQANQYNNENYVNQQTSTQNNSQDVSIFTFDANGDSKISTEELNNYITYFNMYNSGELDELSAEYDISDDSSAEDSSDPLSQYNEEYGKNLAETANELYPESGFRQRCAAGVADALVEATGKERTHGNGCDYGEVMSERSDFTEYTDFDFDSMSAEEVQSFLLDLPAGTVVSCGGTSDNPYGHVMIMDGEGNEISDGTNAVGTWYKGYYSSMRVFIPTGD